jgi:diacylglycerol O-acyltransferase
MPHLDLENQIGVVTVQAPGDEQALLDTCAELWVTPLDIARPLWRLWLLDGLAEGRMAMVIRLYHSLADGAAALDSLIRLFDPEDVPAGGVLSTDGGPAAGSHETFRASASHPACVD